MMQATAEAGGHYLTSPPSKEILMTPTAQRSFVPHVSLWLLAGIVGASCGSSASPSSTTGAAVAGAADTHCGMAGNMTVQTIGVCYTSDPPASTSGCGVDFQPDTGSAGHDAGAGSDDGGTTSDFGDTLYNATGYDDDCKYQISWTSTPVAVNTNVTFTVTASRLSDGQPVHCAGIGSEAFIGNTPAVPSSGAAEMGSTGKYAVGPIKFTQSGMWTVRFHLYEECSDSNDDSPHGHAAFYVMVP
jgi:hypothetical protein